MGFLTNMSRLEKTLLAGIAAGFLVKLAVSATALKTTFDFPERNLKLRYFTENTDTQKNRCGDGIRYRLFIEAQLDEYKVLAAYLDCGNKGYLNELDSYFDYYRCISVQGTTFKAVQHDQCNNFVPLSSIDQSSFFSDAKKQYQELLSLLREREEK